MNDDTNSVPENGNQDKRNRVGWFHFLESLIRSRVILLLVSARMIDFGCDSLRRLSPSGSQLETCSDLQPQKVIDMSAVLAPPALHYLDGMASRK